jgi:hypothetical protein
LTTALVPNKYLNTKGKLDALAENSAQVGDKTDGLKYLKLAYDQHSEDMPRMGFDPAFKNLRGEAAFRQLQVAMKLAYAEAGPR